MSVILGVISALLRILRARTCLQMPNGIPSITVTSLNEKSISAKGNKGCHRDCMNKKISFDPILLPFSFR
jgi:hypothetical protein